jgi:hypothetical protein
MDIQPYACRTKKISLNPRRQAKSGIRHDKAGSLEIAIFSNFGGAGVAVGSQANASSMGPIVF